MSSIESRDYRYTSSELNVLSRKLCYLILRCTKQAIEFRMRPLCVVTEFMRLPVAQHAPTNVVAGPFMIFEHVQVLLIIFSTDVIIDSPLSLIIGEYRVHDAGINGQRLARVKMLAQHQ